MRCHGGCFFEKAWCHGQVSGANKNLPSAAAVQSQQCKQLVEQAGKVSSWSSEEASEACELVHNLLYVAEDGKKQLLEAIAACMAAPPAETPAVAPKKSRAFLQDYTNLYCMLTSNVWNFVMDARTTPEQACMILGKICQFTWLDPSFRGHSGYNCFALPLEFVESTKCPPERKVPGLAGYQNRP